MKKLTLERPKLCRTVLLLPVIIPIILTPILYAVLYCSEIIIAGLLLEVACVILYFRYLSSCFGMIGIIAHCSKNNFEIRKGNKLYIQKEYKQKYHMTLSEFVKSENKLLDEYYYELKTICDSMDNDSCRFGVEAIYYKDNSERLLVLSLEADNDNPNLFHLDKEIDLWSYPPYFSIEKSQITKKQRQQIRQKVETFLKSNSIDFDYHEE